VDEDLEAFEPPPEDALQLEPAPEAASADDSVTRWWSSPEPPEATEDEEHAVIEHEEAVGSEAELAPPLEAVAEPPELPVLPELELPPLPEFVPYEPTPTPDVPADLADREASAEFEAAAAEFAALEGAHVEQPVIGQPAPSPALDLVEKGWTPAPELPSIPDEAPAAHASEPPSPSPEPPEAFEPAGTPEPPEPAPPRFAPRRSDVSELLRGFAVTEARTDRELCRDLKALAGVDLTPPPPGSTTLR
jgi:hypothetical protein